MNFFLELEALKVKLKKKFCEKKPVRDLFEENVYSAPYNQLYPKTES